MTLNTKVSKSYSFDREVIAWLTQKAAQDTLKTGRTVSASEIANDILCKAMEKDKKQSK